MKYLKFFKLLLLPILFFTMACQPPPLGGGGFTKARTPNRTGIILANPSGVNGHDMIQSALEWNAIAGWGLFNVAPVNDPHWLVHADIRFGVWPQPIIGPDGTRRAFWVQPFRNADGTINHCAIWFDPSMTLNNPQTSRHPDTVSHELAHCLDFWHTAEGNRACRPDEYQGVVSYCNFYPGMNAWWQQHDPAWWDGTDVQMLINAGYR